jgi:hypothetical protein
MRRFVTLAVLLFFTVPFGASIVGCGSKTVTVFCSGGDSGPIVGQVKSITLSPNFATFGESINYGQIGSGLSASAVDCKGNSVSVPSYTYATTDMSFADINPSTGQVCGGTWNRNVGGGIPDFTTCTAPVNPPASTLAYVTATAQGAVSNAIPVYVHPIVTSVLIGGPTPTDPVTKQCLADPLGQASNCCPQSTGAVVTAPAYVGGSCLSQGVSAQITARAYKNGTTNAADNITCQIGHLQFSAQNLSVLTIDQNGVATAAQPGSTIVTANVSNSGSGGAAGFFSTCPPASIALSIAGQAGNTASVNVNTTLPLTAVVKDTHNVTLTGVNLTFTSTTPSTIPAGGGAVTPTFPGSATITAICQPPTCNSAPFSQIGLYGNGEPLTSNGIGITAPGTVASVLYIASTQSQYLLPVDFSTGQSGSLLKLPYIPNSMVITQDGSTIYLGNDVALMTVSATNNQLSSANTAVTGTVLSVSPDGSTVVVTDRFRQTVALVAGGNIVSTYGGVGTSAKWSPDSQTVYITTNGNQLLVHSAYTGWYATPTDVQYVDVAVAVPSVGAFFGSNVPVTEGRSYCPATTSLSAGNPPAATNVYYPLASATTAQDDKIAATNDGLHILGATVTPSPLLNDIGVNLAASPAALDCTVSNGPVTFATTVTPHPLTGVSASAITGVLPSSNSALAFVTYNGTSGLLPEYIPSTGAVTNVPLSSGAIAPVAGVFTVDDKTFFAGTSGDNQVHLITINGTSATDTSVITPKLPDPNNNPAVPNLLVQRPKKTTS